MEIEDKVLEYIQVKKNGKEKDARTICLNKLKQLLTSNIGW